MLRCIIEGVVKLSNFITMESSFDWIGAHFGKYEVKMKRPEAAKYMEGLMPDVARILQQMNDPRLSTEPGKVGSLWQTLKVTNADKDFCWRSSFTGTITILCQLVTACCVISRITNYMIIIKYESGKYAFKLYFRKKCQSSLLPTQVRSPVISTISTCT